MFVTFIGDQALYLGTCVKGGIDFVVMWRIHFHKHHLRYKLNKRLPPVRLTIEGVYPDEVNDRTIH
jgi:hypothetical protein